MGVRLLFDKLLAPALAAAGLRSADALFRLGGDPDATSLVTMVDVPVDGTVGRFHLKRYYYPNWAASKGLLGRGTGWGTAPELQEFKNLEFLRQKGVSAVRPVAAAALTESRRLVRHALLTEHIPDAIDLAKRLATPGDPVRDDAPTRRRVAELLGRLVHRMHMEAFTHRDFHARNVLVRVDEDGPAVWTCDCRRGGPPSMRWKYIDDLATLDIDLAPVWPREDRLAVFQGYAGQGQDAEGWASAVEARSARHTKT